MHYDAYVGAHFKEREPSKGSKCSLNVQTNLETGISTAFHECRDQLTATKAHFRLNFQLILSLQIQ